jgi:hypothetical protein
VIKELTSEKVKENEDKWKEFKGEGGGSGNGIFMIAVRCGGAPLVYIMRRETQPDRV